jgi:hypothetical protein
MCEQNSAFLANICHERKLHDIHNNPLSAPWIGFFFESLTDMLLGIGKSLDRFTSKNTSSLLIFGFALFIIVALGFSFAIIIVCLKTFTAFIRKF